MNSTFAVAAVILAVALAGCLGTPDDAGSSVDDTDLDNASAIETEERSFVDDSFSLDGQDASTSWDVTIPNGTTNVSIRVEIATQAASGFAIEGFESCSDSSPVSVIATVAGGGIIVGQDVYDVECGEPAPGDYTVSISQDQGVSEGTLQVNGTVPVDA